MLGRTKLVGTYLFGASKRWPVSLMQCIAARRPSGLVGNLQPASAEVMSSILTKVGFVFFLP